MSAKCETCKYWETRIQCSERQPVCRRFPPTSPGAYQSTKFPVVSGADWCGEWVEQKREGDDE